MSKLAIGTVQFGTNYGVTNSQGQTGVDEAAKIVERCLEARVDLFDTAPMYGNSEAVLGLLLDSHSKARIVTKTLPVSDAVIRKAGVEAVSSRFADSLVQLNVPRVYGLMVHGPTDLLKPGAETLYQFLLARKQEGLVSKIGVSVYSSEQIEQVFSAYDLDLIQLPLNILDQRLIKSGHLKALKRQGVEIHVRSAFLQGILLSDPEQLPRYFDPVKEHLARLQQQLNKMKLTPAQAALGFVQGIDEVDHVVCGVNNQAQLIELLSAASCKVGPELFESFSIESEQFLNPAMWSL